jgi:murein DD-endopeptidase MepM/ murein hydrolase activator NlpD
MSQQDYTKISNIIGTRIPSYLLNQLKTRSDKNSQESNRSNDDIKYIANKTAWVRMVSSVDISGEDIAYFKTYLSDQDFSFGPAIEGRPSGIHTDPSFLAKKFVLFGGTSAYDNVNKTYSLRSGLGKNGAYGILGEEEISQYGYRPMPGITSVTIDTAGRLGSVRFATINFKVWDKMQLDIIDALYFKLGYSMFLEWGHTYFYQDRNKDQKSPDYVLMNSEMYSVDPFNNGNNGSWDKEALNIEIVKKSREAEGNYDGMLGTVTNFNFSFNQEGGYDCSVKLIGYGALADSIKLNSSTALPNILSSEIKQLVDRYNNIIKNKKDQKIAEIRSQSEVITGSLSTTGSAQEVLSFNDTMLKKVLKLQDQKYLLEYLFLPSINNKKNDFSIEESNLLINGDFVTKDHGVYIRKFSLEVNSGLFTDSATDYVTSVTLKPIDPNYVKPFKDKVKTLSLNTNALYAGTFQRQQAIESPIQLSIFPTGNYFYQTRLYSELDIDLDQNTVNSIIDKYVSSFQQSITSTKLEVEILDDQSEVVKKYELLTNKYGYVAFYTIKGSFDYLYKKPATKQQFGQTVESLEDTIGKIRFEVTFTDTSQILNLVRNPKQKEITTLEKIQRDQELIQQEIKKNEEQLNQRIAQVIDQLEKEINLTTVQKEEAMKYSSGLEFALRAIELHALNNIPNEQKSQEDLSTNFVNVIDLTSVDKNNNNVSFAEKLFSEFLFSDIINELLNNNKANVLVDDLSNLKDYSTLDVKAKFKTNVKYGFCSSLLGGSINTSDKEAVSRLKPVDFKSLCKAYVLPYSVNNTLQSAVPLHNPVYINMGLLMMLINHMCLVYENKTGAKEEKKPIVYVDFNPETNLCLSSPKHFSTDPLKFFIPYEGFNSDFRDLFKKEVVTADKSKIVKSSDPNSAEESVFDIQKEDYISGLVVANSPFKFRGDSLGNFRGRTMNVLVNIEYLLDIIKGYTLNDGNGALYLRSFLEAIVSDMNKAMGSYNVFRIAYNDRSNTLHIVDDQIVPPLPGDIVPDKNNEETEIPLYGKKSIAKSLEIKTEVSSKLGNLIAISANPTPSLQSSIAKDGSSFGFFNANYRDRYVSYRTSADAYITGSQTEKQVELASKKTDTDIESAKSFNSSVRSFFSEKIITPDNIAHASNYYTERIALVKNQNLGTRASAMIPITLNFSTDGISGIAMNQSFTVSPHLLPYTYSNRSAVNMGYQQDYINKVGFCIVGLTHRLENNQWNTDVRSHMIFIKSDEDYGAKDKEGKVSTREDYVMRHEIVDNTSNNTSGDKKGSTKQRNTNLSTDNAPKKSEYIFGSAKNLGNSVQSRAHGARDSSQEGQWQSANAWDLMTPAFTPIYAIFDGSISNINYYELVPYIWGLRFTLVGQNQAFYTHLDRVIPSNGQKVSKGDLLGYVGQPPADFGWQTHLHIGLQTGVLSSYIENDGKIK